MMPAQVHSRAVTMLPDSGAQFPDLGGKLLSAHPVKVGIEIHQMWMTRPNAASTLSCIISLKVGCGKTVWMKSSSTSSAVLPMV